MRKTFEFVKIAGSWFYWKPNYDGCLEDLRTSGDLLEGFGEPFVRLHTVDKAVAKVVLSLLEITETGAMYLCKSNFYNGKLWMTTVLKDAFGEYPKNIYLSNV